MGYSTDFEGAIEIVPPLNEAEVKYLNQFFDVRHMERTKGPYFVGSDSSDVTENNYPPAGQPGLWCDLMVSEDGTALEWNGNEKSYDLAEWVEYVINHFLKPNAIAKDSDMNFQFLAEDGHVLNGVLDASGEEAGDIWRIVVKDNIVTKQIAQITYED